MEQVPMDAGRGMAGRAVIGGSMPIVTTIRGTGAMRQPTMPTQATTPHAVVG